MGENSKTTRKERTRNAGQRCPSKWKAYKNSWQRWRRRF
jgi:hypothetical protein